MAQKPAYSRIMLKLSGEMLGGQAGCGIETEGIKGFSREVLEIIELGVRAGIDGRLVHYEFAIFGEVQVWPGVIPGLTTILRHLASIRERNRARELVRRADAAPTNCPPREIGVFRILNALRKAQVSQ